MRKNVQLFFFSKIGNFVSIFFILNTFLYNLRNFAQLLKTVLYQS